MSSRDQQPFSSNNPFRRKLATPSASTDGPAPSLPSSSDRPINSTPRPPLTTFKSAPPEDDRHNVAEREDEPVPVQPKPKKVVKRVRVQSPPPSSPEDAVSVTRFPAIDSDDEAGEDGDISDVEDYEEYIGPPRMASFLMQGRDDLESARQTPPANPFSKTLEDLEQTGQGQDLKASAKGALDVDSFKRLLLTGYANVPGSSSASAPLTGANTRASTFPQSSLHDGVANTDSGSSRKSTLDAALKETPRNSQDISETEDPVERKGVLPTSSLSSLNTSSTKKKPPPPSSRHGKLIKIELGAGVESRTTKTPLPPTSINTTLPPIAPPRKSNSNSVTPLQSPRLTTDVNKPLPLTPFRPSVEEAVDSPFDREAIGKVPEPFTDPQTNPRSPTPPVTTRNRSGSNGSTQVRKPVAPPPRRHGRSDSKAPSVHATNADEDTPPRSSFESNRSRADSVRTNINSGNNPNIPAPPPPRRPNHARQGSSYTAPSQGNFAPPSVVGSSTGESERGPIGTGLSPLSNSGQTETPGSLATITTNKDGIPKLSPPPPPPTRQASTRRPPSVRSVDLGNGISTARRVSREKDGGVPAPPPPPPRQRGSSRASVETPAPITEDAKDPSGETQREHMASIQPTSQAVTDTKQGAEILADLDALQREVDALMGRYGKVVGS